MDCLCWLYWWLLWSITKSIEQSSLVCAIPACSLGSYVLWFNSVWLHTAHNPTLVLWYSYVGWSLLFVFNTFTYSQYLCAMTVLSIQEIASRIWPSCSHSESRSMLQLRSSSRGDQQEDPFEGCLSKHHVESNWNDKLVCSMQVQECLWAWGRIAVCESGSYRSFQHASYPFILNLPRKLRI